MLVYYLCLCITVSLFFLLLCFAYLFVLHAPLFPIGYFAALGSTIMQYTPVTPLYHSYFSHRFPIVEPDPGHTKLRISKEGLEAFQKITTPIAAVAVSLSLRLTSLNTYLSPIYLANYHIKEHNTLSLLTSQIQKTSVKSRIHIVPDDEIGEINLCMRDFILARSVFGQIFPH